MPKVTIPAFPLNAVFAIAKPSGPVSMTVVDSLKPLLSSSKLFGTKAERAAAQGGKKMTGKYRRGKGNAVKIGTGGTLDPLADGVLVLGVNGGTKQLGSFLNCTKVYRTTCLLGCETDSYDSEGSISRVAPSSHITTSIIEEALGKFRGDIVQVPPVFSAIKMDGRPLYEYARNGIPLPRPIEARKTTVHSLTLEKWLAHDQHSFNYPSKRLSKVERENAHKALAGASVIAPDAASASASTPADVIDPAPSTDAEEVDEDALLAQRAPSFVLRMEVAGGTYVRSIVHDLCRAMGTAGHVVTLTRLRQGQYVLEEDIRIAEDSNDTHPAVPWQVIEDAQKKLEDGKEEERDVEGWAEWERAVLRGIGIAESRGPG